MKTLIAVLFAFALVSASTHLGPTFPPSPWDPPSPDLVSTR